MKIPAFICAAVLFFPSAIRADLVGKLDDYPALSFELSISDIANPQKIVSRIIRFSWSKEGKDSSIEVSRQVMVANQAPDTPASISQKEDPGTAEKIFGACGAFVKAFQISPGKGGQYSPPARSFRLSVSSGETNVVYEAPDLDRIRDLEKVLVQSMTPEQKKIYQE